ncbi:MAG TPA: hypothetical protein VLG37_02890 [Candidatus Saccharimonadales bacterium]|nr:hypothetical protein [Candidatus Saccharimonadales bacterium]
MSIICPTITAQDAHTYREEMERVEPFAHRLHIDLADGVLAPRKLIDIDKLWWPGNKIVDLHVMYQKPFEYLELFIVHHPNLVIVHAEADGDFRQFAELMHRHGIEVGLALLPETEVRTITPALPQTDHVLFFSGNLGYQGGSKADFGLLEKVKAVRKLKPSVEIGWDGGVNDQNAKRLAEAGVDVLNAGGFIQKADDPAVAYRKIQAAIQS